MAAADPAFPAILIRADASARIGIGHVRRCLTLARALVEHGCHVRFAVRDSGIALGQVLAEFADDALRIPADDDTNHDQGAWPENRQAADFAAVAKLAGPFRPQIVVVDHYGLDAIWHGLAKNAWSSKIVAVDDLADRALAAEMVIDHNWHPDHRAKYHGQIQSGTMILGGPRFALIDQKFSREPDPKSSASVESVGIFMGGTDPAGANAAVLEQLRRAGFMGRCEIVSTSLNPAIPALRAAVAADPNGSMTLDQPDLFDFFRRHDLYILAAGGTTWERMASAAPAIAVVTASNQRAIADQLAADGYQWTVTAGKWDDLSALLPLVLGDAPARQDMAARGRMLVDGRGGERAALAIITSHSGPVTVRAATPADANTVFNWRNDPSIRSVSRNSAPLDLDAHIAWFTATLGSPDRLLLIGEKAGVPIGTVRFDRQGDARFEISIFISPMLAGLRLGGPMMDAAQAELVRREARDVEILAETLADNLTSQRLFQRAGYRQHGRHFQLSLNHVPSLSEGSDMSKG